MMGSPSAEYVALCQSQVILLTQALGAVSTVVYLAEAAAEASPPALTPLVAYPETADRWGDLREGLMALLRAERDDGIWPPDDSPVGGAVIEADTAAMGERQVAYPSYVPSPEQAVYGQGQPGDRGEAAIGPYPQPLGREVSSETMEASDPDPAAVYPLVLPLAHEGVMLGMMVSTRERRSWTPEDYRQAEQVASTLAIACVLDQRNQWLQRQLAQRQVAQADQSETFHDLLHQFRNPLTALQTFGKLMVKRLPQEDTNRPIAEGIVRESRRLQDLAQHFDDAVATADESLGQSPAPRVGRPLLPAGVSSSDPIAGDPITGDQRATEEALAIVPAGGHGLGRSLRVVPGAIADIALPLVQSVQPLAQERGLDWVTHIPSPLPAVWLEEAALGEVLHNLIDNALKYAPAGSLVWVTAGLVQQFEGQIFQGIAVGDTGPGIPQADQARLFTRYFRGVQAQGEIPGTGLGLAIVQDLVQGMGGHIDLISPVRGTPWLPPEADSNLGGAGSLFVVWLRQATEGSLGAIAPVLESFD
jgi:signal transduction histidine kinase